MAFKDEDIAESFQNETHETGSGVVYSRFLKPRNEWTSADVRMYSRLCLELGTEKSE